MSYTEFSSKWRLYLWPIHGHELRKLLPMLAMFFLVTFNYQILRNAKDTLIVTAQHAGAEAIPFIKIWAVLPAAVLMALLYTKLSHRYSREKVFSGIMIGFLSFIFLFTFVLHPLREYLHPDAFADWLQSMLPMGAKGFVAMIRYWTLTGFYVTAELWSSTVLSVLLWGFVNEVTTIREAKRFYGIFGVGAHLSGIGAGALSIGLSSLSGSLIIPWASDGWSQSLYLMNSCVLISGAVVVTLFWWMHRHVLNEGLHGEDSVIAAKQAEDEDQPKVKMSLRSTMVYLANSPYLLCIAAIVLCYNLSIHLVEVVWKDQVRLLYPNPSDYSAFQGKVTIATDIVATITSLFICGNTIRRFGWTAAALVTPAIIGITSIGFFGFLFARDLPIVDWMVSHFNISSLWMVVLFGTLQMCLTRAAKFSMFDATKEMAFVPLSRESRLKGKAAIDGVGSRLGKSGSAVLHSGLLMVFSSIAASTPYIALILPFVLGIWVVSARALGLQFHALTTPKEPVRAPVPVPSMSLATEAMAQPVR
ncbi:MAG: Npt1/Npt2 family nucleotide transporter [Chlamydiia bacterium]